MAISVNRDKYSTQLKASIRFATSASKIKWGLGTNKQFLGDINFAIIRTDQETIAGNYFRIGAI